VASGETPHTPKRAWVARWSGAKSRAAQSFASQVSNSTSPHGGGYEAKKKGEKEVGDG
jgi:hypothetical protein